MQFGISSNMPLWQLKQINPIRNYLDKFQIYLDQTFFATTDNASVYSMLKEATRATVYAPTVKPYARKKDGRAAYFAMMTSHIGDDKWDRMQKDNLKFLMNTEWNGKVYGLEKFTGMHRSKYALLGEAAVHVNFQW